jgi:hypothetical protein
MPYVDDAEYLRLKRLEKEVQQPREAGELEPSDFDLSWNATYRGDEPREVLAARQTAAEQHAKTAPDSWEGKQALQASIVWGTRLTGQLQRAQDAREARRLDGHGGQIADPKLSAEGDDQDEQPPTQPQPPQPPLSAADQKLAQAKEAGDWAEVIRLGAQRTYEQGKSIWNRNR